MRFILKVLRGIDRVLFRVETVAIVVGVLLMVGLAFYQIAARNLPGGLREKYDISPVPWFDVAARYLVLWVGLLGASVATVRKKHINIEIMTKFASPVGKRAVEVLVDFAALAVVCILIVAAYDYVIGVVRAGWIQQSNDPSRQPTYAIEAPGIGLFLPEWVGLLIMPIGMGLIAFHLMVRVNIGIFGDEPLIDTEEAMREEIEQFEAEHHEEEEALAAQVLEDSSDDLAAEATEPPGEAAKSAPPPPPAKPAEDEAVDELHEATEAKTVVARPFVPKAPPPPATPPGKAPGGKAPGGKAEEVPPWEDAVREEGGASEAADEGERP